MESYNYGYHRRFTSFSDIRDVCVTLLLFLLYISIKNVINIPWLSYAVIVLVALYCFIYLPLLVKSKEVALVNVLLFVYLIWEVYTGFIHQGGALRDSFLASIVHSVSLVEMVLVVEVMYLKGIINYLVNRLFKIYSFFAVAIMIQVVLEFIIRNNRMFDEFIIGNNFQISYFFFQWAMLFFLCSNYRNETCSVLKKVIVIVIALVPAIITTCSTSIVAGMVFGILIFFEEKIRRVVTSKAFFLAAFILSLSFIFIYMWFLKNSIIQNVIISLLKEELTLTGRTHIYDKLPLVCYGHLFTGYGYGNASAVLRPVTGCPDAQNGFWQILINMGLVGAVLYAVLMSVPFFANKNNRELSVSFPVYAYLIYIIVVAFVEIPYTNSVVMFAIMGWLINRDMDWRLSEGSN